MTQYAQSIDVIFVITSNSNTPHTSIIKYMHTRFNHYGDIPLYLPSISPLYILTSTQPHPTPTPNRKIIIIIITFSGQLPHRRSCVQVSDRSATNFN